MGAAAAAVGTAAANRGGGLNTTHHAMKQWQCCTVCSAYVRVRTHMHVLGTHMHQWECQWELKQEGGVYVPALRH